MTTPKQLDLRGLSEAERNEKIRIAVARIAGWVDIEFSNQPGFQHGWGGTYKGTAPLPGHYSGHIPHYATSFDAVLPLLEKWRYVDIDFSRITMLWTVQLQDHEYTGAAFTLPLAACIALLRAHGVGVIL